LHQCGQLSPSGVDAAPVAFVGGVVGAIGVEVGGVVDAGLVNVGGVVCAIGVEVGGVVCAGLVGVGSGPTPGVWISRSDRSYRSGGVAGASYVHLSSTLRNGQPLLAMDSDSDGDDPQSKWAREDSRREVDRLCRRVELRAALRAAGVLHLLRLALALLVPH